MSIATAIQNAQQKVANAYTAVNAKGGTLPATQDLSNLPTAINSVPTGDEITATNTTGSAVSADDKVWVNGEDIYTQNFTIVGSPTIVNKVVSNFSTSNYLQVSPMVNTTSGTWTFDVEFTYVTSGASAPQPIVFFEDSGYDNFTIFILNDHINAHIPSTISAGYEMLYSPNTLTSGETYHLQLELTANSSKIYIKHNGSIIETLSAESGTYLPTSIIGFTLGGDGSGNYYFAGSLDLNNTNIKINNSTAWSPYTKTGTNYSIINDTDITSTSFTGIAQEAIANNGTGSVKTLLDGNGTYAPTTATKSITTNGTYTASAENAYGFSSVTVDVPSAPTKKYNLLDRVKDDNNNEIGTVSGFFTDANNVEYAVVCLDAQYRLASGQVMSEASQYGVPLYKDIGLLEAKETATQNTDAIITKITQQGFTSTACSHCRNKSFTIDGTTYYGQLSNILELIDIFRNMVLINSIDTSASSYSNLILQTNKYVWSSTQYSSTGSWCFHQDGVMYYDAKNQSYFVIPVLEIPNT